MWFLKRNSMKSFEIDLGPATLDRETGRISGPDGKEFELRHQSRKVLVALARKPGETMSRETLIEDIWDGRAMAADSVAQCVAEIRRALEDTDKRIVETVPREGYRLALPPASPAPRRALPLGPLPALALVGLAVCAVAFVALRPGAPSDPPVIAVLPFEDFSTADHRDYLNDAVSENIVTMLARYPQLTVVSRRSSFQFRESDLGISAIADRLGADFVLEGSQHYDGARLLITAQLIDAASDAHIWADEIDVPLDALLETNSEISRKIANAVGFSVIDTSEARMTAGDVSALMIANAAQSRIMRNYTRENLLVNLEEQEKAIRDYPESAWGYLGQALALRNGMRQGWIEGDEVATRKRMYDLARQGIALDPNNFMAYHALGRVLMFNRDVEAATAAFQRGADLNPSSSLVIQGLVESLIFAGNTDRALELIARLERIDPLYDFGLQWTKAWALWQVEDCSAALEAFQSSPAMPIAAYKQLAAIHHCLGNERKAAEAMAVYMNDHPNWAVSRERDDNTGMWTAPGALNRWLAAMEMAGMPL